MSRTKYAIGGHRHGKGLENPNVLGLQVPRFAPAKVIAHRVKPRGRKGSGFSATPLLLFNVLRPAREVSRPRLRGG